MKKWKEGKVQGTFDGNSGYYENKAADEQHFTRVLTDEEWKQIYNNGNSIYPMKEDSIPDQRTQPAVILPDEKCTYCGGVLELYSARIKVCKLCERRQ